jgi:hypothetical protein
MRKTLPAVLPGPKNPSAAPRNRTRKASSAVDFSNDPELLALIERGRQALGNFFQAVASTAERKRDLGEVFREARPRCKKTKGGWSAFCSSCEVSVRFAEECIVFVERWPEVEEYMNAHGRARLKVDEIRKLLSNPRQKSIEHNPQLDSSDRGGLVPAGDEPAGTDETPLDEAIHVDVPESGNDGQDTIVVDPGSDREAYNESWLKSLPLHCQLGDPTRFDRDALLWRKLQPTLGPVRAIIAMTPEDVAHEARQLFMSRDYSTRLVYALYVRPPGEWKLCHKCRGKPDPVLGRDPCWRCKGVGYLITHEGERR